MINDELGDLLNVPKTLTGRLWYLTEAGLWIIAGDVHLRKGAYASFGHWKGCENMIPALKGIEDPQEAYRICLDFVKGRMR